MPESGSEAAACSCMGMSRKLSLRTLCVALAAGVTFVVLMGMVLEQDKISACVQLGDQPVNVPTMQKRQEAQLSAIVDALKELKRTETHSDNLTVAKLQAKEDVPLKWDYNWDKKQWGNPDEAQGVGTRTVLLVRHGQYDLATGKLTDKGRQQANLTGIRLTELAMKYRVITHSPMVRAQETAQLLHAQLTYLPVYQDFMLEEGGPVPPEPTVSYWKLPERDYFVNGPRMESAFRKYFFRADKSQHEQTFEIIVAHGNLFRYFALRALQLPANAWMRLFIAHASISQFSVNPDGTVTMTRLGDSGHFPPDLVTY